MLRQVYILKDDTILYNKNFGKSMSIEDFQKLVQEIVEEAEKGTNLDSYDFFKYKIVYSRVKDEGLMFIFITDINDELRRSKDELEKLKKEFLEINNEEQYFKHAKTTLSLYYNGQSGKRFSWVYGGSSIIGDDLWGATNDLIYVPGSRSEINLIDYTDSDGNSFTADQQWTDLEDFINSNEYLKEKKGDYVERNGDRLPFTNNIDLKIVQDLFLNAGGYKHTLQITFDIFNFGNLINKEWGRKYYVGVDTYSLIIFE